MAVRSFSYWLLALQDGGVTPEALAQLLAALSVREARSMFWSKAELAEAFGVGEEAASLFLRRQGIKPVRLGGRAFYPKVAIVDRLHAAAGVELVLAAGAAPFPGATP